MRRVLSACGLLLLANSAVAGEVTIHHDAEAVEVRGLSAAQLDRMAEIFTVSVDGANGTAMLGESAVVDGTLRFTPRFPWTPGLTYVVRCGDLTEKFTVPALPPSPPVRVAQVYPTADVLPENLLKLYLHFSAPMSRGDSYEFVRLLDADGDEVELPFLELGEELWNPACTRMTLLLDPGRVKQGLKPREEAGPALESGKQYTLVVARDWPDADGRPLAAAFRKAFRVGPPDETQPDPAQWTVTAPTAREPLVVEFGEPLDHALLERVLTVQDARGRDVPGTIEIDRHESRWQFRPARRWRAGAYRLVTDTVLEDLAGNSVGRPFELDVLHPVERRVAQQTVARPFRVE